MFVPIQFMIQFNSSNQFFKKFGLASYSKMQVLGFKGGFAQFKGRDSTQRNSMKE